MTDNRLRERVLDALDDWYENTGGNTPDHIIVSASAYERLRAEQLKRGGDKYYIDSGEGYIGMVLWSSEALDARDKNFLMFTDEQFAALFPNAGDWRAYGGD